MDTQVSLSDRKAKVPMYDLFRRIFPLVNDLLPPLKWLGLLKCCLWSSERLFQRGNLLSWPLEKWLWSRFLAPTPPIPVILLCGPKLVASPRPKCLFSYVSKLAVILKKPSHEKAPLQEERADYLSVGSLLPANSGQSMLTDTHQRVPGFSWFSNGDHPLDPPSAQPLIGEKTDLDFTTLPKTTTGEWWGLATSTTEILPWIFPAAAMATHTHSYVWGGLHSKSSDTALSLSNITSRGQHNCISNSTAVLSFQFLSHDNILAVSGDLKKKRAIADLASNLIFSTQL